MCILSLHKSFHSPKAHINEVIPCVLFGWLAFSTQQRYPEIQPCYLCQWLMSFVTEWCSIAWVCRCLSIYLLGDIWLTFGFWPLQIKLPGSFVWGSLVICIHLSEVQFTLLRMVWVLINVDSYVTTTTIKIQNISILPESSVRPLYSQSPLPFPAPGNSCFNLCPYSAIFLWVSYTWNHRM